MVALGSAFSIVASLVAASASVGVSWDPLNGDVPYTLIQANFELVDFNAGS